MPKLATFAGPGAYNEIKTDIRDNLLKENMLEAQRKQQELANKRADAQLKMQQDAADRAANTYQLGLDKQKAISDAYNIQKNITSGQPGQDRFEAYANIVGATPEYDKAVAELDASGVTGADRNAQLDNLRDFYSEEINAASAANSPKLEDLSRKYSVVNESSGYDGLKSTIADNSYQQRVFDNLMATGLVTPAEADAQSKIQSALTKTDPLSKEAIAQRKAMADNLKDAEKNELDILKASSEKMKLSGKGTSGSGSDSRGQYNPDFEKVIKDSGFGASSSFLGDWGKSPNAVRKLGLNVASELKAGNAGSPTKGQMGRALIMSQTGAPDKWRNNDANVAKAAFKESLLKVMKEDLLYGSPDSKSGTGATTTSKYGDAYKSGAEAIMSKYANLRNQLNAGAQTGQQLKGTGLAELEATYSNLDKPKNTTDDTAKTGEPSSQGATTKVSVKNSTGEKTKVEIPTTIAEEIKKVPTATEEIVTKKVKEVTDKYKDIDPTKYNPQEIYNAGYDVVSEYTKDMDSKAKNDMIDAWKIVNSPDSNFIDKMPAYQMLLATGTFSTLLELANHAGGAGLLVGETIANAGNTVANFFRSDNGAQPSFSTDRVNASKQTDLSNAKAALYNDVPLDDGVRVAPGTTSLQSVVANPNYTNKVALPTKGNELTNAERYNAQVKMQSFTPAELSKFNSIVNNSGMSITERINGLKDLGLTSAEVNQVLNISRF